MEFDGGEESGDGGDSCCGPAYTLLVRDSARCKRFFALLTGKLTRLLSVGRNLLIPLWGPCSPSWFCRHLGPNRRHLGRRDHTKHYWSLLFSRRGVKLAGQPVPLCWPCPETPRGLPLVAWWYTACEFSVSPFSSLDYWVHADGATSCPDRPCLWREGAAAPGQSILLVWGRGERGGERGDQGEAGSRTAFGMSGKIWKIDLTIVSVLACVCACVHMAKQDKLLSPEFFFFLRP